MVGKERPYPSRGVESGVRSGEEREEQLELDMSGSDRLSSLVLVLRSGGSA